MLLISHITIALISLVVSGLAFVSPTKLTLRLSSALIAGTLTSGTILVVSTRSHMIEACLMGLLYTGVTLSATIAGRNKLALGAQKSH